MNKLDAIIIKLKGKKEGVLEAYSELKGGKTLLTGVAKVQIQAVFEKDVQSAQIKVSKDQARIGVKAGETITVERKGNTFVYNKKRVFVYAGDEIISTTKTEKTT